MKIVDDPRITAARAFLAAAKQRKFQDRPNSVLVREAAELRHQLGQVLKAIDETERSAQSQPPAFRPRSIGMASFLAADGSGIIIAEDLPAILSALAIAARWADLTSSAVEAHLDIRDDTAAAYRQLARQLGPES